MAARAPSQRLANGKKVSIRTGAAAGAAAAAGDDEAPERREWTSGLKVGSVIDCRWNGEWHVAQIVSASERYFKVHLLYWASKFEVERQSPEMQPLSSKTNGAYTGPPHRHQ
jgi:hypothetical protein